MIASENWTVRGALWTAGLALGLGLVAGCGKRESTPTSTTETTAAEQRTTPQPPGNSPAPLAAEDKEFAMKAAQGGMEEVAMGRAVEPKAASPQVKAFAARMVKDHGTSDAELKMLVASKGLTLPDALDADKRKEIDEMTKLAGPQLDKEYADDMVEDHEQDVKEFKEAQKKVKDPELRAWITKTLPTLEGHLTMAKDMQAKSRH